MNPAFNWSVLSRAYRIAYRRTCSVCDQHAGRCLCRFLQPLVLIGHPSSSPINGSLMWFCTSPELGTNSDMQPHDRVILNETAGGHEIVFVSRTRPPMAGRSYFAAG